MPWRMQLARRMAVEHQMDQAIKKLKLAPKICGCPERECFASCPLSPLYCVECFGSRRTWLEDDSRARGGFYGECERCAHLYAEES